MIIRVSLKLGTKCRESELVPVDRLIESAEEQVQAYNKKHGPSIRGQTVGYDHFHLYDCDNQRVVSRAVVPGSAYSFALPQEIAVESASAWKSDKLHHLGILFQDDDDFLSLLSGIFSDAFPLGSISQLAKEREKLMASLENVSKLTTVDEVSLKPVEKALFVMAKYPGVESAVDLMIVFLLQLCGFYNEQLFAFPQFPFKIHFGDITADAKPDFTIFDLKTFYRIAVIEDKSDVNIASDSNVEAQLMAEAIAMTQANRVKSRDGHPSKKQAVGPDKVLGIKIRGSVFTFYVIPVTNAILDAMTVRTSTTLRTTVMKSRSFDLCDEIGSREIVLHLLLFREIAAWTGRES